MSEYLKRLSENCIKKLLALWEAKVSFCTAGSSHEYAALAPSSLAAHSLQFSISDMHTGTSSFGSVLVATTIGVEDGFFKALNFVISRCIGVFLCRKFPRS